MMAIESIFMGFTFVHRIKIDMMDDEHERMNGRKRNQMKRFMELLYSSLFLAFSRASDRVVLRNE